MPNPEKSIGHEGYQGPEQPQLGENYLLVIAIDQYQHCPKLNNCVSDSKAIIKVLHDKYGFTSENTFTLGLPQKVNATGVLFLPHDGCWRKRA